MAITQGTFDVVFDAIKSTLESYNSTQDPEDQFNVYADWYRMFPASGSGVNVFLYLGSIVPTERTLHYDEYSVTYFIDLIVSAKGKTGSTYNRADEAAGIRFRGLVQQMMEALKSNDNYGLGTDPGTIGKFEMRIDPLSPEQQTTEQQVAAGRVTLTASMCYQPSEISGIDLESILITADKWSALIEP